MINIKRQLMNMKEEKYKKFQLSLIPGMDDERFLGVRFPLLKKLAKAMIKDGSDKDFLSALPHFYHEENLIHGFILGQNKDFDICIDGVEKFLPYIDNWAICDSLRPSVFSKNKDKLLSYLKKWISSSHVYTVRFALEMLMLHFLDDRFQEEYLLLASGIKTDDYYLKMMIAWYFATALAKQWNSAIIYLENKELPQFIHNKTIQKATESYRIPQDRKTYLRTLRR